MNLEQWMTPSALERHRRKLFVLEQVRNDLGLTKSEIAERLELSERHVGDLLRELGEEGLVAFLPGRPRTYWPALPDS